MIWPSPPPPDPSPVSKLSLFLSLPVRHWLSFFSGGGGGEELTHTTARKSGPQYIIQHSLVTIFHALPFYAAAVLWIRIK
jgi:hypothetical protein